MSFINRSSPVEYYTPVDDLRGSTHGGPVEDGAVPTTVRKMIHRCRVRWNHMNARLDVLSMWNLGIHSAWDVVMDSVWILGLMCPEKIL